MSRRTHEALVNFASTPTGNDPELLQTSRKLQTGSKRRDRDPSGIPARNSLSSVVMRR